MSIDLAPKIKEGRILYVLVPLLLLHLTLISLQVEEPHGTILLKKWVLLASTPFFDISSKAFGMARDAWRNYLWLHGAREENARLKDALRDLALREKALAEAERENIRLRQILRLKESYSIQGIAAHVVGRVPGFLSNITYIDQGAEGGVCVDQPVLSDVGVIGRILLASRHHSQVQLITNPNASVGAMVERTRSPGVLSGTGNPLLELRYIGNTDQVNVGDTVVTSGLDGIFPKGLPIGRVVESRKGKSVFRFVQVEPFVDLLRIENVLIVTKGMPLQE